MTGRATIVRQSNGGGPASTVNNPASTKASSTPLPAIDRRKAISFRRTSALTRDHKEAVEEVAKDYQVVFSDKLEKLVFPLGLKPKPLGSVGGEGESTTFLTSTTTNTNTASAEASHPTTSEPLDEVQSRLCGLPGHLSLDPLTTRKYFGSTAREKFFRRFQWLSSQRMKTSAYSSTTLEMIDPFDRLYFEEEPREESFPFQPIRPRSSPLVSTPSVATMIGSSKMNGPSLARSSSLQANEADRDGRPDELDELEELQMLADLRQLSVSTAATSSPSLPSAFPSDKRGGNRPQTASILKRPSTSDNNKSLLVPTSASQSGKSMRGTSAILPSRSTSSSFNKGGDAPRDLFSDLILDSKLGPKGNGSASPPSSSSSPRRRRSIRSGRRKRGWDDGSVVSAATTVATIDLLYPLQSSSTEANHANGYVSGSGSLWGGGSGGDGVNIDSVLSIDSPRSKYILGCIEEQLQPHPALLIRRNMSKVLNLPHLGMGNRRAILLAQALRSLPFVQSLNVADNMLTDDGLGPIILSAVNIPGLIELNLSQNIIGPLSSNALFAYLRSPSCPLERLILNAADVDDYECQRFVDAIKVYLPQPSSSFPHQIVNNLSHDLNRKMALCVSCSSLIIRLARRRI